MSIPAIESPPLGHNNPPTLGDILRANYADLAAEVEAIAARANEAPKAVRSDAELAAIGEIVTAGRAVSKKVGVAHKAEKEPFLTGGRTVDGFFRSMDERLDRISEALSSRASEYQRAKAAEARRLAEEAARKAREEEERQREIARRAEETNRARTAAKHEDRADDAADRAAHAEAAAKASAADLTRLRTDTGVVASARTEWAFEITDYAAIPLDQLRPYLRRDDVEKALRSYVRANRDTAPLPGVRFFEDIKANFR